MAQLLPVSNEEGLGAYHETDLDAIAPILLALSLDTRQPQ